MSRLVIRSLLDRRRTSARTVPGLPRLHAGDRLPALHQERQPGDPVRPRKEPAPAPPGRLVAGEIAAAGLPVTPGSICAHFDHDPRPDRICRDCGRRTT